MNHQKNQRRPPLPVDRGWAWLVMLGAFFNTFFNFMFMRSLSIFFIEFLDKFQKSATVTTLAFGLNTAAFIIGAFVLPPCLLSRFTVRFVTLLGSFINAAAIVGLAFSPNMICLTTMFVFIGFAHPFIFVSQCALLGVYFKKRLSFAVAFSNLGLSGGLMVGPYLTRVLLDEYGLTGSLLIHAGINLNLIAGCMLFRPVSFYAAPPDDDDDDDYDEQLYGDISALPEIVVLETGSSTESLEMDNYDDDDAGNIPETNSPPCMDDNKINRSFSKRMEGDSGDDVVLRKKLLAEELNSNSANHHDSIILCHPRIKDLQMNGGAEAISVSGSQQSLESRVSSSSQNSALIIRNGKTHHTSEMCINSNNGKPRHHTASEMCISSKLQSKSNSHSKSSLAGNGSLAHSISQTSKSIIDFMSSSRSVQYFSNSEIYIHKMFESLSSQLKLGSTSHISRKSAATAAADTHSQTSSKMITVEIIRHNNGSLLSPNYGDCFDNDDSVAAPGYYENSSTKNSSCLTCCGKDYSKSKSNSSPSSITATTNTSTTNTTTTATSTTGAISPKSSRDDDDDGDDDNNNNNKCFNPLVVMLFLLAGIGVQTQCGAAYMPSLGKDQGVSDEDLPILMTIIGAVDLCKLFTGYIADQGFIRRIYIVLVCQSIMGISFQFVSYFQGFEGMVALCVIFGANTGVLHILLPGITVDLLGREYIGQVMSGYFLINGAIMTLCHILIGFLKDTTGSFAVGYNMLGGFALFGALIILMEPLFVRLAKRRSSRT